MVKVSVLVPVYNNEKYLRECLDSVANQSLNEIEIICINDGSTDISLSIMKEYESKDKRFVILNKSNTGYGDSLNKGIEKAVGEYIAIVESDDFIEPNMMERLYDTATKNNAEIVKSNFFEYSEETGSVFKKLMNVAVHNEVFAPWHYSKLFTGEIFLWTSVYKKEFLTNNDIWFNNTPGASYQDVSFILKAYSCADRVIAVDEAFYHYRKDNPNSSVKSKEKVYCVCDEFDEIEKFLSSKPKIRERVKKFLPYMLFVRYKATYHRIDEAFRVEFLIRMINDLEKYGKEGMYKELWRDEDWEWFLHIKEECSSDYYLYNRKERLKLAIQILRGQKKVYLYGAGIVAKRVKKWLDENDIGIEGFLITEDDNSYNCDEPVMVFKEIKKDLPKNYCILLSVGEKLQAEILVYLLKNGITSVIPMNADVRRSLFI